MLSPSNMSLTTGGGTPIRGHTRGVRQEWVNFRGQKSADGS